MLSGHMSAYTEVQRDVANSNLQATCANAQCILHIIIVIS